MPKLSKNLGKSENRVYTKGVEERQKCKFGEFLEMYRGDHEMSLTDLADNLEILGHPFSISTISRYENGTRNPSPAFLYFVSLCLDLDTGQIDALIEAHLYDVYVKFIDGYEKTKKKHEAKKKGRRREEV